MLVPMMITSKLFFSVTNYWFRNRIKFSTTSFLILTLSFLIKGSMAVSTNVSASRFASSSLSFLFFNLAPGTPHSGSITCKVVISAPHAFPRRYCVHKYFFSIFRSINWCQYLYCHWRSDTLKCTTHVKNRQFNLEFLHSNPCFYGQRFYGAEIGILCLGFWVQIPFFSLAIQYQSNN